MDGSTWVGGLGVGLELVLTFESGSNEMSRRIENRMERNREQEGRVGSRARGACPGVYMGKRGGSHSHE